MSTRFVLVALSNYSTDTGKAYPSIDSICEITGGDRKTIISSIQTLIELGIITDTGKRTGNNSKIKVYQLPVEAYSKSTEGVDSTENGTIEGGDSTENGTIDSGEKVQPESNQSPTRVPKTVLCLIEGTGNREQGTWNLELELTPYPLKGGWLLKEKQPNLRLFRNCWLNRRNSFPHGLCGLTT